MSLDNDDDDALAPTDCSNPCRCTGKQLRDSRPGNVVHLVEFVHFVAEFVTFSRLRRVVGKVSEALIASKFLLRRVSPVTWYFDWT